MEIGSIYEINPKTVEDIDCESVGLLELREVQKYNKEYVRYTGSGREAIALALKSMEERNPNLVKKCLLPAYMCDTVFFPFIQAGWELFFYHIEKNLEVKMDELRSKIEHIRPGLLFIHSYYGVDTWKPMRPLLHKFKNQGIYIMEDVTQSYYLDGAGDGADYVIGSLRKWYAVPDGGFAASSIPLPDIEDMGSREFMEKRLRLLTEKWEYLNGQIETEHKKKIKDHYLSGNKETEAWLDHFSGINTTSDVSKGILLDMDENCCKIKRNENYKILYEELKEKKSFTFVLEYQKETAPLYFPIYAKDREKMQSFLQSHDIYAPVLWPVGEQNKELLSEDEQYIFTHILAIPMDQRYGKAHMKKIVDVVNDFEKQYEDL